MIQSLASKNHAPDTGGFWQRLDPRVKIICIFSLALAVAATPIHHRQKFLAYTVIILLLMLISRVPLKHYFLRFVFLIPLLAFLSVSLLVFSQDRRPQKSLILYNLLVKTFLVFCSSGILALTVRFPHLVRGLEKLKFPRIFTTMLFFAYRYVFLFYQEAVRVMKAWKSRSPGRRKKWKVRNTRTAAGMIPFFIFRVLERSQRIYAAMLSRGYEDRLPGVTVFDSRLTRRDYLFALIFHLVLIYIWLEFPGLSFLSAPGIS
jgi:cobalt/nickel transport system permease protein